MSDANLVRISAGSFVAVCNGCGAEAEVEVNLGQQREVEDLADELADPLYYGHEWENHRCPACNEAQAKDDAADAERKETVTS
jgi:transcription elongation factor Elf1